MLAVAHSLLVGRNVAAGLPAGRHSFRVALKATARQALRRHRRLALKVKLIVTPPSQSAVLITRHVAVTT